MSIATTALRNSGWWTTPTGAVAYSRETARSLAPGRAARVWIPAAIVSAGSPMFAPSPMYARTRLASTRLLIGRLSRMADVAVLILHPEPGPRAGELERWVASARATTAERHRRGFLAAGATSVSVTAGPPDGMAFGARLREFAATCRANGVVVLGSGAIPMATSADRRAFVAAASSEGHRIALTNNRFSADVVAVSHAASLGTLPDLATDNALPRWLAEVAGYEVTDLRRRWRLGVDIDGPLELVLLDGTAGPTPAEIVDRVKERLAAVRAVAADPRAELIVAGRTSAWGLAWLERQVAARTRAIVEERGLRTAIAGQRPPRSVLGALLEREGPASLGSLLAELGEGAIVDSRVLLAHRHGADQATWPAPEDRFASDLLLHERIEDPWLRELTQAAAAAPIPIVLGGHTLVGPGLRLALRQRR
jgi:hypothetical protein